LRLFFHDSAKRCPSDQKRKSVNVCRNP
jgi:hypothetical protein